MKSQSRQNGESFDGLLALIEVKRELMRFYEKDIAYMVHCLETIGDPKKQFLINCIIEGEREHLQHLGQSIETNKEWIRDAKRQERV
jgi:hypothetical protein